MSKVVADLHAHTTFSDGRYTPGELADRMVAAGLAGFAVTDHDTVAGLRLASEAALERNIEFVPGIEMSTQVGGVEMHVLGYYIDVAHPLIVEYTTEVPLRRRRRAERIVARLNELGVPVSMDDVAECAGEGTIGRPHIAQVLQAAGHASSIGDAFVRFIRDGGPAFVATEKVDAAVAIGIIREAGGVAVLAHPGHWTRHSVLLSLIRAGLDGIEVRHPSHKPWLSDYYRTLAADFVLLKTGGSDYHGHRPNEDRYLGRFGVSADEWSALRSLHEHRRAGAA